LLRQLVLAGRRIGDIGHLATAQLEKLVAAGEDGTQRDRHVSVVERALEALGRFDVNALQRELGDSLLALGAATFVRQTAVPLLREVGERWGDGRLTVSDEHLLSGVLRNLLGGLVHSRSQQQVGPRILLATPTGERHDLGIVMAGLLAVDAGLCLYFLGAEAPAAEIVRSAERAAATVVGLSLVDGSNDRALVEVRRVARQLPASTEMWLGGCNAEPMTRAIGSRRVLFLADPERLDDELRRIRTTAGIGDHRA
jgi:methylmalonyl-CoA mutase cobalamin-binding subunit